MIALNHGMSGILMASALPLPLAIPMSIASHFVLDAMPHYGISGDRRDKSRQYKLVVYGDFVLAMSLNIPIFVMVPGLEGAHHRWDMLFCGWLAVSPDLSLVHYYVQNGGTLNTRSRGWFSNLHSRMQHFERPWAIIFDSIVLALLLPLFFYQLG